MTAAIALALIGLTPGLASAAAPKNAPAPVTACQKISCATALPLNKTVKGGGHNIDFWKVTLVGGYRVSFAFTAGSSGGGYGFDLYAPSTKDGTFYQTGALVTQLGPGSGSDFTLQAPYTGTFILAVCQAAPGYNVPGNCAAADPPPGGSIPPSIQNPMSAYSFTAGVEKDGITTSEGKGETKATTAIAAAPALSGFESGGGQNIDFWKIHLIGGYKVQFYFTASGSFGGGYGFDLYAPSTKDSSFYQDGALVTAIGALVTAIGPPSASGFTLQAPYTGTFILAVCQAASGYNVPRTCGPAHPPNGESTPASIRNPMSPYTFTAKVPPLGQALKPTTAPAVSGTPKAGSTLYVTSGVWSPTATSYSYQWYLGSKPIGGATSSFLPLTTADKGSVYVVVTAYRIGYVNGSYKSTPVTVT